MTPGDRVKKIREILNVSQGTFGQPLGFKWYKVKDLEAGKIKVSPDIATKIANIYSYRFEWILTGEGPMKKDELPDGGTSQYQTIPPQADFPAEDFVFIRQVNGKISAGGGLMPDDSADFQCAFRRDWIKKRGGKPANMSLIKVSGDSMEPTLLSGDLVMVDHSRTIVTHQGGIYAIAIGSEIMIKRIQDLFPQNKLRILSDNPHYEPIDADPDQVKINGKVIWFGRDMDK